MKPAFSSLKSLKRLPLTLAAACMGIGGIGLAVTLHKPVALSPFSPATRPVAAVAQPPAAVAMPEPFNLIIESPEAHEAPVTELPAETLLVAAPRPVAPVVQQPPAVRQVPVPALTPAPAPAAAPPAPDPGPGATAADAGPVTPLGPGVKREATPATVPDTVGSDTPGPDQGPVPVPNDLPGTPAPNEPSDSKGNGNVKALGLENGNGPKQSAEKQAQEKPSQEKDEPARNKK